MAQVGEGSGAGGRESCLQEAQRICDGARGSDYGHPFEDWTRTAALWSPILGIKVTPLQALLCMNQVKVSRLCKTPDHHDSIVDIAGYAYCYERVVARREGAGP